MTTGMPSIWGAGRGSQHCLFFAATISIRALLHDGTQRVSKKLILAPKQQILFGVKATSSNGIAPSSCVGRTKGDQAALAQKAVPQIHIQCGRAKCCHLIWSPLAEYTTAVSI